MHLKKKSIINYLNLYSGTYIGMYMYVATLLFFINRKYVAGVII